MLNADVHSAVYTVHTEGGYDVVTCSVEAAHTLKLTTGSVTFLRKREDLPM